MSKYLNYGKFQMSISLKKNEINNYNIVFLTLIINAYNTNSMNF